MAESPAPMTTTRRKAARWRSLAAGLLLAVGLGTAFAAPAAAEVIPVSELEIVSADCDRHFGPGQLEYVIRDPFPFYRDFVTVTDAQGAVVAERTYLDEVSTEFEDTVDLAPGTYEVIYSVEHETGIAKISQQSVTIACPDIDVTLKDFSCSTGQDGAVTVALTGLVPGESYRWSLNGGPADTVTADDETLDIPLSGLPPGNAYVIAEWEADGLMMDWQAFAVDPCQPGVTATVTQCTVPGGTGTADVALSGLIAGVSYSLTGPDGSVTDVVGDASGAATVTYPGLAGGTHSGATIRGTWTVDEPYEEPPFIGGGDFVPLESVELAASADIVLEPCPTPPATPEPEPTPGPMLADSGADSGMPLTAGILLLTAGVIAVLARRRHLRR